MSSVRLPAKSRDVELHQYFFTLHHRKNKFLHACPTAAVKRRQGFVTAQRGMFVANTAAARVGTVFHGVAHGGGVDFIEKERGQTGRKYLVKTANGHKKPCFSQKVEITCQIVQNGLHHFFSEKAEFQRNRAEIRLISL